MGVKTYKGPDGGEQELSVQARRDKQARDKAAMMTSKGKERKRENQTFEDKLGKGQRSDSDIHHTASGTMRRVETAWNRATYDRNEVKT